MIGSRYVAIVESLTMEKYLGGGPLSLMPAEAEVQADDLLGRVIGLLCEIRWEKPFVISSGYRSPLHNQSIGGAKNSYHVLGKAIDIFDPDNLMAQAIEANPELLAKHGLWMEDPAKTKTWVHLDTGFRPDREIRIFKV